MVPGRVSPSLVASSAIPKSAIFTSPLRPSSTFAGLRSRCTVPRAWIASRPRASSSPTSAATPPGNAAQLVEGGAQVDPVHVLLRDVVLAPPADPVVDGHHVLVVHGRGGARLAREALDQLVARGELRPQALEDREPFERAVPSEQDDAHPALAELAFDREVADRAGAAADMRSLPPGRGSYSSSR